MIKKVTDQKNKEKNYKDDDVKKEDDLPNKPMAEPKDTKKQLDHKVQDPVKLRKKVPDTKLVIKNKSITISIIKSTKIRTYN